MRVCRLAAWVLAMVLVWGMLYSASASPALTAAPALPKTWWSLLYEGALLWASEEDGSEEITWTWPVWDWFAGLLGLQTNGEPPEVTEKTENPGRKPVGNSLIE